MTTNNQNEPNYGIFIATILKNLEKNGFPQSQVAFPLDPLWASADKKGLNFRKVLDFLKEKSIDHEMTGDKIIFKALEPEEVEAAPADSNPIADMLKDPNNPFASLLNGPNPLDGLSGGDLMSKATEFMKNMSPQQLSQIQQMVSSMTPEERENLMEQAKGMGFPKP